MLILLFQVTICLVLVVALVLWIIHFPYPSPLVRRWLPARRRWPEQQIRAWLRNDKVNPGFLRYFNRDPERVPPPGDGLLAPADGLVTGMAVRDGTRYLVIALSFWDMHVQRSPLAGRVVRVTALGDCFVDGEGRNFAFLREKHRPVQKRLVLDTEHGEIAVRLVTSLSARRIEMRVHEGDILARGQRIGRILLGSTVVLELPATLPVRVRTGERVWAGETVVAEREATA